MSKWATDYLAKNYVQLWIGEKPKGKDVVGDDLLRLCYIYLASYANENNNFECWVSAERQANDMRKDERSVRRARSQLQSAGLMIDTGRQVRQSKVWQIVLPGYAEWISELTKTGAYTPDASTLTDQGADQGAKTGADQGAKTGADQGAKTGAKTGATQSASTSQTEPELEKKCVNTNQQKLEQTLLENAVRLELTIIKSQIPFENICNSANKQALFLPVVKQALKKFGDKSANDRDCAVYVLSKIHPDNRDFKCSLSTHQTLNERYCQPAPDRARLIDGQTFIGDLAKNYQNNIDEPF
jgi:hypothetical protein